MSDDRTLVRGFPILPKNHSPCKSCPYRLDAKLGFWHPDHFFKLLQEDARHDGGSVYGCHEDGKKEPSERRLCAGWALDQKARGIPSISFRVMLARSAPISIESLDTLHDGGVKLFDSLWKMCEANLMAMTKGRKKKKRQPREAPAKATRRPRGESR